MPKSDSSGLKKIQISSIFYALSDPARIEIVRELLTQKEITCGECKSHLSKSTMSHHFKVLRETGLIEKREEGKTHYISLRIDEIEKRIPGLIEVLKSIKSPL